MSDKKEDFEDIPPVAFLGSYIVDEPLSMVPVTTDKQKLEALVRSFGVTDISERNDCLRFDDIEFQFSQDGKFCFAGPQG